MLMRASDNRGFSLIELMIVVLCFGLLVAFSVPGYLRWSQTMQLRGASENLVETLQLQRTRAMATGQTITLNFNTTAPQGWTVLGGGQAYRKRLPKGVHYVSAAPATINLTRDGRVNNSALVVFRNQRGALDTVSVLASGLALIR